MKDGHVLVRYVKNYLIGYGFFEALIKKYQQPLGFINDQKIEGSPLIGLNPHDQWILFVVLQKNRL